MSPKQFKSREVTVVVGNIAVVGTLQNSVYDWITQPAGAIEYIECFSVEG